MARVASNGSTLTYRDDVDASTVLTTLGSTAVGSALLAEDMTGKGHSSRVTSKEDSFAAMIDLA